MPMDHISRNIKGMVTSYCTAHFTAQWQSLEKGIVSGCEISPILMVMEMNLLITAAEKEVQGPKMESDIQQPPIRGEEHQVSRCKQHSTKDGTGGATARCS